MKHVIFPVIAAVAAMGFTAPGMSTVTQFAAYNAPAGTDTLNFLYTSGATPTIQAVTTSTGTTITDYTRSLVNFTYSVDGIASTPILSYMTFSLTGTRATTGSTVPTTNPLQILGTIAFTPVSSGLIGTTAFTTASNLLTVTLAGSALDPSTLTRAGANLMVSGDTGIYADDPASYDGDAVKFTSDFLSFDNTLGTERAAALTGSDARTTASNQFLASSIGTFSSDPAPTAAITGAVPEVATWAMMLLGFGAIGGSLRGGRRQRNGFLVG